MPCSTTTVARRPVEAPDDIREGPALPLAAPGFDRRNARWLAPDRLPPITAEPISAELIRACVGTEHPTILEIGANNGGQTCWFAEMFEDPGISCFEPDPRAIARFRDKVGDRPGVELFELALSDRNGTITFHQSGGSHDDELAAQMPEGWDLSGSIRPPKDHLVVHPWVTFDRTIEVETMTLDSWAAEHGIGRVDFIWMDVQGAEADVFRGGERTLAATRFLYTEYSDRELYEGQRPLTDLLDQLGDFDVVERYRADVLLRNRRIA